MRKLVFALVFLMVAASIQAEPTQAVNVQLETDKNTVIDNSPLCYNKTSSIGVIAFFQELLLPQCEIQFPCADMPANEMVGCLQTRASINYQLKNSQILKDFFSQQADLQNMFLQDPDYREAFRNLHLKSLYEADAGVYEKYTIARHTTMALVIFEAQHKFWGLENLNEPAYVTDKTRFMKHLVAYHDIGKSIPAKLYAGDRKQILANEISYSYPIAWRVMLASKYSMAESKFAIALIATHKVIGDFLQSKIGVEEAKREIDRYAQFTNVSPKIFLKYLEMLFIADAGSYPGLQYRVFDHQENGQMTIKDQLTYEILKQAWN